MIETTIHGDIHELRLDRPPVNALSPDLLRAISEEVREAPGRGARAVILSGREGMFSAGLDVPVLMELDREAMGDAMEAFFGAMEALAASEIPIAAAITGHSPAGGAILALFCDWRVMAEGPFTIGFNEVRIGVPMPEVVAALAARTVGPRDAEILCVSGRLVEPDEALALGLVDEVAPMEMVVERARLWCEKTLESPPHALAVTRSRMRRDLVELVQRYRSDDERSLAEEWFAPELQATLRKLVASLKGD
jgi:enoyl-CoA hydratase/carnithine racemase